MITARAIRARFSELEPYFPFIMTRVKETLIGFADSRGYAVVARSKTVESVSEKIETGRYPSWSAIDDLVACTIVIPKISDETEVLEFLKQAFLEIKILRRGSTKKSPDVFRFECTRFIGKLNRPADILPTEPAYDVMFEIQVRTAFEHAWSVTTHDLTYKNEQVSWERLRLAAQLKATIEQLDMLVAAFEDNTKFIPGNPFPEMDAREEAALYFQGLFQERRLPEELRPKDWTRFAENLAALLRSARSLKRDTPQQRVQRVIGVMSQFLATGASVSLNLSLLQFTFALLVSDGIISEPFVDYVPTITEEMELLYPSVRGISTRFDFAS